MDVQKEADIPPCSIGLADNSLCHQKTYNAVIGLKTLQEFKLDEQRLLILRSAQDLKSNSTVCLHHKSLLLTKFEFLQKKCCNPFSINNHNVKSNLQALSEAQAEQLKPLTNKSVKPGQKLCISCKVNMYKQLPMSYSSASDLPASDASAMEISDRVNTSLVSLGVSPIKIQKISKRDSKGYVKRKICKVQGDIGSSIAVACGFNPDEFQQVTSDQQQCQNCTDYKELLNEIKEKMKTASKIEKFQLLTLAPKSWSIEKIASEFSVSHRLVRKANNAKQVMGILALPSRKMGKVLPDEIKQRVLDFFEDDEFSRLCPGKKDYVSVRVEGVKVQKQKRLLLSNLKEMHVAYRKMYGREVSFSKFCTLRPKWCVTVGASGMHSVCVCSIHQNVKNMLYSSIIVEDYKVLIQKTVCNIESKSCMLHRCEQCPGKAGLEAYLDTVYEDVDPEEIVEFQQWVQTDRTSLESKLMLVGDFLSHLVSKVYDISVHHFVSKHQAQYLRTCKENLKTGDIVVLMDFAENYSFVVQDAVQGFHWENSQASLHPFVVYYHQDNNIQCLSACVISDSLRHDTIAVHVFMSKFINYLKKTLNHINYASYFSDGCTAQYKNFKHFVNLCHHKLDYGFSAEWNFFGTSHGKSPCDGIGGTAKRLASRASLQRIKGQQILIPQDLFNFCEEHIKQIKFFYVSKNEIESHREAQNERFKNASTVTGTRDNHQFVPLDEQTIKVSKVSGDPSYFVAKIGQGIDDTNRSMQIKDIQPGQYVACIYDNEWWVGNICEVSEEEHDARVKFMHPPGPAQSFHWPAHEDKCWVSEDHLLKILPSPTTTSGRLYSFPKKTLEDVMEAFNLKKKKP